MKRILFYPGTFNPPHFGHISAVKVALDNIAFDEVWIMPSGKRVDKEIATSLGDRKNLGNILVEHLRTIIKVPVNLISSAVDNIGDKYTHELIMELKAQSNEDVFQLVGIDGYLGIKERAIGPNEKFVIIKRSGYEFPRNFVTHSNLVMLDEEIAGISSTKIREMVKNRDESYKKLVPKKVSSYIKEKNLYL
jgi:nicotinate-nucleotide adenylyltransferase